MAPETTDTDWLRRAARLTAEPAEAWPTDQLLGGEVLAARLVALARALPVPAATARGAGDHCSCAGGCPLGDVPGGTAACRLAADLAERAPSTALEAPATADLPARYLVALRDAAGAVYFCRRVQHAGGRCWFSAGGPADDLCGRVLAVAHSTTPATPR